MIKLKKVQYLLLLAKLEAPGSPRRRSLKQREVDVDLDRLEDERALASAIDLYASLKDADQGAGARDPPVPWPLKRMPSKACGHDPYTSTSNPLTRRQS